MSQVAPTNVRRSAPFRLFSWRLLMEYGKYLLSTIACRDLQRRVSSFGTCNITSYLSRAHLLTTGHRTAVVWLLATVRFS